MTKIYLPLVLISLFILTCCNRKETPTDILKKTINTIDTIETIYFKQDLYRSNPQNTAEEIYRYREMYFKRLTTDSIVGVKGHWYMFTENKGKLTFEDIYDGKRVIRINNRDKTVRVYDLQKYPAFKKKHFWGHNTLYLMQRRFSFVLENLDSYRVERLNDTIIDNKFCYQIRMLLENKMTMPGFKQKLEDQKGSVSETLYFIDKETYYPLRMRGINYSVANPKKKIFIDQRYYDIQYNLAIDEAIQFNTSNDGLEGYKIREVQP